MTISILAAMALLVINGCQSTEKKKEKPGQKETPSGDSKAKEEEPSIDTSAIDLNGLGESAELKDFVEAYHAQFDTASQIPSGVLSRFSSKAKEQYALTARFELLEDDSTKFRPAFTLQYFDFGDTTKMQNAITNLMACFGQNCDEIEWGIDTMGLDTRPNMYLIGKTTFYAVHHGCSSYDWNRLYSELITIFGKADDIVLKTDCHGAVHWETH